MAGKVGRSGPKPGHVNAIRNGCKISKSRLVLGTLPPAMRRQQSDVRKYRRTLEDLVVAARNEVTAMDSHLIDEACAAEVHSAICRWLMRTRIDKMSVSDITRCSEQICKAKRARNVAVKALDLDAPPPSPWALDVDEDDSEEATDA